MTTYERMYTIEDLRDDTFPSGFKHVELPRQRGAGPRAKIGTSPHYKGEKTYCRRGPRRATIDEAAQDAVNLLNGLPVRPAGKNRWDTHAVRLRYDENDLGPRSHARRSTEVEGRQRSALEHHGPVTGEFKHAGVGWNELKIAFANELIRRDYGLPELGVIVEGGADPGFIRWAARRGVSVV